MTNFYTECAVHATILSTGSKILPGFESYVVTRSYLSCPFLCSLARLHSDLLWEASFSVRRGEALHGHHLPVPLGLLHISKLATLKKLHEGWYERLSRRMSQLLKGDKLPYFHSRDPFFSINKPCRLNKLIRKSVKTPPPPLSKSGYSGAGWGCD